jgi:anti-anti-sigma regulatory factor
MTTNGEWIHIDPAAIADGVRQSIERLNSAQGEMLLDFSSVGRIDSQAASAIEQLAALAGERSDKVVLSGVNGDIYKVLKLLKLTERFWFVN